MATSSADKNKSNVKGFPNVKDPSESTILVNLDSDPTNDSDCDPKFTPEIDPECEAVSVQLQSVGGGYLRYGDTLRAKLQVNEPLTSSNDGRKIELGRLPWPATRDQNLDLVPLPSVPHDECEDIGYWSDRPGEHPVVDFGRLAWPVDCNGQPADEFDFDEGVGTYRTRNGHPIIHKPKAPSGCSFSPIYQFSNSTTGSLPADAKEPLEIGLVNEDCCCTLNLLFTIHYTYTINNLQLPNGASEINMAFKGYAGEVGGAPRCWTFEQCPYGNVRNKVISGQSTLQVSIPPKSGTTTNFWTSIGTGQGETVQPLQFDFNTQIEVCWLGGLDC